MPPKHLDPSLSGGHSQKKIKPTWSSAFGTLSVAVSDNIPTILALIASAQVIWQNPSYLAQAGLTVTLGKIIGSIYSHWSKTYAQLDATSKNIYFQLQNLQEIFAVQAHLPLPSVFQGCSRYVIGELVEEYKHVTDEAKLALTNIGSRAGDARFAKELIERMLKRSNGLLQSIKILVAELSIELFVYILAILSLSLETDLQEQQLKWERFRQLYSSSCSPLIRAIGTPDEDEEETTESEDDDDEEEEEKGQRRPLPPQTPSVLTRNQHKSLSLHMSSTLKHGIVGALEEEQQQQKKNLQRLVAAPVGKKSLAAIHIKPRTIEGKFELVAYCFTNLIKVIKTFDLPAVANQREISRYAVRKFHQLSDIAQYEFESIEHRAANQLNLLHSLWRQFDMLAQTSGYRLCAFQRLYDYLQVMIDRTNQYFVGHGYIAKFNLATNRIEFQAGKKISSQEAAFLIEKVDNALKIVLDRIEIMISTTQLEVLSAVTILFTAANHKDPKYRQHALQQLDNFSKQCQSGGGYKNDLETFNIDLNTNFNPDKKQQKQQEQDQQQPNGPKTSWVSWLFSGEGY